MEKTFEELIEEKRIEHSYLEGEDMIENHVLQLLQQVREATIAECKECLTLAGHDDIPLHWIEQKWKMNQIPTDRITVKE